MMSAASHLTEWSMRESVSESMKESMVYPMIYQIYPMMNHLARTSIHRSL